MWVYNPISPSVLESEDLILASNWRFPLLGQSVMWRIHSFPRPGHPAPQILGLRLPLTELSQARAYLTIPYFPQLTGTIEVA